MTVISIMHNGNVGNKLFQYFFCKKILDRLPDARIANLNLPEFGLMMHPLPLEGRKLTISGGHIHCIDSIAYKLRHGIYDSLDFGGYVQRLEYLDDYRIYSNIIRNDPLESEKYLGKDYITVNVRGLDIFKTIHPDYQPVPISFLVRVVEASGLIPVIMGQVGEDEYSCEIQKRFSGGVFLPHVSAYNDFQTIRYSTNIVHGVSTFSWWAAWISKKAEKIHMPVSGIFNPIQRPDINLLPLGDDRYVFYDLPIVKWVGSRHQVDQILHDQYILKSMSSSELKMAIL